MREPPDAPPPKLDYASPAVGRRIRHSPGWIATEAGVYLIGAIAGSLYFQSLLVLYIGLVMAAFGASIQFIVNRWGHRRMF